MTVVKVRKTDETSPVNTLVASLADYVTKEVDAAKQRVTCDIPKSPLIEKSRLVYEATLKKLPYCRELIEKVNKKYELFNTVGMVTRFLNTGKMNDYGWTSIPASRFLSKEDFLALVGFCEEYIYYYYGRDIGYNKVATMKLKRRQWMGDAEARWWAEWDFYDKDYNRRKLVSDNVVNIG